MSAEEIRKYDPQDEELKRIFGERFTDETEPGFKPRETVKKSVKLNPKKEEPEKPREEHGDCEDAEWRPEKLAPTFFDNLVASAKCSAVFACLNVLIFYWQQVGLMDESIAVPSMCVCAALCGWGVGKSFARK